MSLISTSTSLSAAKQARRPPTMSNGYTPTDFKEAPEGDVWDPNKLSGIPASLVLLVKDCGDWLERNYAGWGWKLQPNFKGQVVSLTSIRVHPNYGVIMHGDKLENDRNHSILKQYVGEFFERFGLPRKPYFQVQSIVRAMPRDYRGYLIPDMGTMVTKMTKNEKVELALREGRGQVWQDPQTGKNYMSVKGGL